MNANQAIPFLFKFKVTGFQLLCLPFTFCSLLLLLSVLTIGFSHRQTDQRAVANYHDLLWQWFAICIKSKVSGLKKINPIMRELLQDSK